MIGAQSSAIAMTSTSDRPGFCARCGCANGNHDFGQCRGVDRKGSKSVKCKFEWSRCTTGGHDDNHKYVDCARCPNHPADNT
jgi:hypothetical protein